MLSCFAMKLASVAVRTSPPSLELINTIVQNPDATSYYTDACGLSLFPLRQWMLNHPALMSRLSLHSQTKPPGPIVYWIGWIELLGVGRQTALAGGIALGVIGVLSIPATYLFLRLLTGDCAAGFCGASFLAACPGFVLFFPMFDPAYVLLSTSLISLWLLALRQDRARWSVLLGAVVAFTCFVTFNVLVIGLFMLGLAAVVARPRVVMKHGLIALGSALVFLAILWPAIGYDPIATFRSAWHNQHALLAAHADQRPYPATILFDLYDFALGSGFISVLLVGYYFDGRRDARRAIVWLAVAQLVAVAGLGLLQMETARVWNFMLPLLMIPIGLELARWPAAARVIVLGMLALVTAAICQNLKFIY